METDLIDYFEDPLKCITIFVKHTSSEGFFPFSHELAKAIALLSPLTGPSSVVIDLPKLPPYDIPPLTPISLLFVARNICPDSTAGSSRLLALQPSDASH